jgi:hypothetical protein
MDLSDLVSLIMTVDSSLPQNIRFRIDEMKIKKKSNSKLNKETTRLSHSNEEVPSGANVSAKWKLGAGARFLTHSVVNATVNTATVATNVVTCTAGVASGVAVGAVKGVTLGAASAVRTVASGDPSLVISAAQNTVLGVGNAVALTGANIANGTFLQTQTFVVLKMQKQIFTFDSLNGSEGEWKQPIEFDFDDHSTSNKEINELIRDGDGLEIFCFRGSPGFESLISYQHVPVEILVKGNKSTAENTCMKINLDKTIGSFLCIIIHFSRSVFTSLSSSIYFFSV